MFRRVAYCVTFAAIFAVSAVAVAEEPISLFNGQDFNGWFWESSDPTVPLEKVWTVQEGVIACAGQPTGYIVTQKDDYADYVLTLEWRWPGQGGNNGVLVHSTTPRELGIWPKSLEVQLGSGDAGDFWTIGTEIDVENEETRKQDRRHLNLTDNSEKPLGEWNTMEITCKANEVIVKVNDTLVNHATNVNVTSGAISLQSEGAPIEFRNVKLQSLPK